MSSARQILPINSGSDGDGRKWPKHTLVRNDQYYLEKLGERWIKDLPGGPQPNVTYQIDKLPAGYGGFERQRPDSKHIDRYMYGHQRGQFRSLNEFYPHFKFLMDYGNAFGCECKNCANGGGSKLEPKVAKPVTGTASESRPVRAVTRQPLPAQPQQQPVKRKLADMEGTPDVYEALIEKLKVAGPKVEVDEPFEERLSPDWRTGNDMCTALFATLKDLPRFVPRIGEVVMFVRRLKGGQMIAWNEDEELFQCFNPKDGEWLDSLVWEAGVVTQMPEGDVSEEDLLGKHDDGNSSVAASFRIEPISEVGAQKKPHSRQYAYVPLNRIRPLSLWNECINDVQEEWHPTIKHALTVTNSMSVVGRYRFKGRWPHATVFCRGAYIGHELVMVGDTVKLLPRTLEQSQDLTTEIMEVTAIRFRFVNLDLEETSGIPLAPSEAPYQTCLHISGRVYTLDRARAYGQPDPTRIDPKSNILPPGVSEYGECWYHYLDPSDSSARLEVPFTRVLSRCPTDQAIKAWFGGGTGSPAEQSIRAGGKALVDRSRPNFQYGLEGVTTAREYSKTYDPRIKIAEGKSWFWADTRIEQLDLWEVNNRPVGVKDASRTREQMGKWRGSLRAMDGKSGAVVEFRAKKKDSSGPAKLQSPYGMVAAPGRPEMDSGVEDSSAIDLTADDEEAVGEHIPFDAESSDDHEDGLESGDHLDAMEMEDPDPTPRQPMIGMMGRAGALDNNVVSLDSSEESEDDDDDDASETDVLAAQLAQKIRPGQPRTD